MARYEHSGAAPDTTLVGGINSSATALVIADAAGWTALTGAAGKFWIAVDPDTASEEHMLINSRVGTSLSLVNSSDRGLDGTTATDHAPGAVVRHIFSGVEADAMNLHMNDPANTHAYLGSANVFTALQTFNAGWSSAAQVNVDRGGATTHAAFGDHANTPSGTLYIAPYASAKGIVSRASASSPSYHIELEDSSGAPVVRWGSSGTLQTIGQGNVGGGTLGAVAGYTRVGNTGNSALVQAQHGTLTNADMLVRGFGTGAVKLQDEAGTTLWNADANGARLGTGVSVPSSAAKVIGVTDAATAVTGTPTGGGWLYSVGGNVRWKGSAGVGNGPSLGWLGYTEVTAPQGGITTEVDLTGLSVTFTADGTRKVRIVAQVEASSSIGSDEIALLINEGATRKQLALHSVPIADRQMTLNAVWVVTPTAGAHTYKLRMVRSQGTGTVTMAADTDRPCFILAEDIGAS